MQHRHKSFTVGYNPRRLLSNSGAMLLKSPRILTRPCSLSTQRPLSDTLLVLRLVWTGLAWHARLTETTGFFVSLPYECHSCKDSRFLLGGAPGC